ncbi:hypothetical protein DASC09_049530 [Saccharomycopsis crataegensis]|uniref:Uncharacterized protein n=1 Tax=Saccharomycopsis crataegensis TaxID=43959 RepID=A0AAV5QS32_9ASCO|nr:hypothetical protein DASC09_049530 [Saccharomycopsis crataegensis]
MDSMEIDKLLYKTEDVVLFDIPPPRKEDGFKHNISRWDLDVKPLWKGVLEIHEVESLEDYADINPFATQSPPKSKDPKELLKLWIILKNPGDDSEFAKIPKLSSLDSNDLSIIPTDSSKVYAVFPEIDGDVQIEINNVKQGKKDAKTGSNSNIKRIGMGLKFPSSYEASNFSMYLNAFEKDFKVFEEAMLDELREAEEAKNNETLSSKGAPEDEKVSNETIDVLNDKFYDISMKDDCQTKSTASKFESESDDSDDDFGDFMEVSNK